MYNKREEGFSMVELMIAMTVFIVATAATSNIFLGMFTQMKQQSKLGESGMENAIGTEILRNDIVHAGDGLPWVIDNVLLYTSEAVGAGAIYNDVGIVPRAIRSGNAAGVFAASDIMVLRGLNMTGNVAAQKWTQLRRDDVLGPVTRSWSFMDDLNNSDTVIVVDPGTDASNNRKLIAITTFGTVGPLAPLDSAWYYLVYGLDTGGTQMPFNRADYYISTNPGLVPFHCAKATGGGTGTGVLVKAEVSQTDGTYSELPLIDCVADMQVVYRMDLNSDGDFDDANEVVEDISGFNAQTLRTQLGEVRIYVLVQVGQRDANYTNLSSTIDVGENLPAPAGTFYGTDNFSLATITANWTNYRWKVETLVVRPYSIR